MDFERRHRPSLGGVIARPGLAGDFVGRVCHMSVGTTEGVIVIERLGELMAHIDYQCLRGKVHAFAAAQRRLARLFHLGRGRPAHDRDLPRFPEPGLAHQRQRRSRFRRDGLRSAHVRLLSQGAGTPLPPPKRAAEITSAHRSPDGTASVVVPNMATAPLDLGGWRLLIDTVESFPLPETVLAPGQPLGAPLPAGSLSDAGRLLTLIDASQLRVDSVAYAGGDPELGWSASFA
jgi:hypothetical protein